MTTQTPNIASAWVALGGSITLGSCAQIVLKLGANAQQAGASLLQKISSRWVLLWFLMFAAATYLWISALTALDLSYAYPLMGLGYLVVTALAALVLHERVTGYHWVAVLLIATGAACIAGSL